MNNILNLVKKGEKISPTNLEYRLKYPLTLADTQLKFKTEIKNGTSIKNAIYRKRIHGLAPIRFVLDTHLVVWGRRYTGTITVVALPMKELSL